MVLTKYRGEHLKFKLKKRPMNNPITDPEKTNVCECGTPIDDNKDYCSDSCAQYYLCDD